METILVVDDEAPVRALARDILLGAGYRVLEAEDGEQALRVVEEHRGAIHVLLTDIMMPGITGKELANRLAAVRTDTKTIFMSGRASEVVSAAGVLIPVDAFVAKLRDGCDLVIGNRFAGGIAPGAMPLLPRSRAWTERRSASIRNQCLPGSHFNSAASLRFAMISRLATTSR